MCKTCDELTEKAKWACGAKQARIAWLDLTLHKLQMHPISAPVPVQTDNVNRFNAQRPTIKGGVR
jgi:hypothetical protein